MLFLFLLTPTTQLLQSYPVYHNTHSTPILYYDTPTAHPGLGDRLSSLLSAYIFAVFSRRVLVANLQHPAFEHFVSGPLNVSRTIPPLYNLSNVHQPLDLTPLFSNVSAVRIVKLPAVSTGLFLRIAKRHPQLELSKSIVEHGVPDEGVFAEMLQMLFHVDRSLQNLVRGNEHALRIAGMRYVAVHVRLGKGIGESRGRFNIGVSWDVLAECLGKRVRKMAERWNTNVIYVATDTPEFVQVFKQKTKWGNIVALGGGKIHTAKCGSGDDKRCKLIVLEMLLLGKAKGIVGVRSSFGRMAALMGGVKDFDLVDVKSCSSSH